MILGGELDAGQQIKEVAIAERLGVGRSSVREALRALEAAGLVRIEKNRGAFVRVYTEAEAVEMYIVRESLEGLAGRLAAARVTDDEVGELRAYVDELDQYTSASDFHRYFPLNLKFHDRVVELAGNSRLVDMYRRLTNELHTLRRNGLLRGGGLSVSNIEHRRIVDALDARDPEAAAQAMVAHTRSGKERFLKHMTARPRTDVA